MDLRSARDRLVDKMCRQWEARRQAAAAERRLPEAVPHPFTVVLSREAGIEAGPVAEEVAGSLGWAAYDHELLELIAQEMHLRTSLLDSVDEKRKSWMKEAFERFLADNAVSEVSFVSHLIRVVLALGAHGECVIVGRGAGFILPAESTLRVRLVAPLLDRVNSLSASLGVSHREAERQINTLKAERTAFLEEYFVKGRLEPEHYDLIVNVSRFSTPEAAELIVTALRHARAHGEKLQPATRP
jgi:cytidylate kinase